MAKKKGGGKKKTRKKSARSQLVRIQISTGPGNTQDKKNLPSAPGVGSGIGAGVSAAVTPNAPVAGGLINPWLQNTGRNADLDAKSFARHLAGCSNRHFG